MEKKGVTRKIYLLKHNKEIKFFIRRIQKMNENMRKRNEILAQTVIKGLESRNMTGYYAADKEEAVKRHWK